ncbi:hypothetical protein TorRG33x02_349540 [Trema orientale]|uniref:Uncharacterized protein n=1 Tax=Trema orientale TaxID=63057 RepID=A0A2P5AIJ6_TREOI|nr:hypothetical protein TorRG33x02_349540 [Trema orientale]
MLKNTNLVETDDAQLAHAGPTPRGQGHHQGPPRRTLQELNTKARPMYNTKNSVGSNGAQLAKSGPNPSGPVKGGATWAHNEARVELPD